MIGKIQSGWQTTTADLALILFLVVSASAVDQRPENARVNHAQIQVAAAPSLESNPSAAVYRATKGITLSEWLSSQAIDERQMATVLVTRAGAGPSPLMEQATQFFDEIEASGQSARLLVERGDKNEVTVVLGYDRT